MRRDIIYRKSQARCCVCNRQHLELSFRIKGTEQLVCAECAAERMKYLEPLQAQEPARPA